MGPDHSLGDFLLCVLLTRGGKGRLAGEELIHEDSQRPPVHHEVVTFLTSLDDLGCHVLHRPTVGVGHLDKQGTQGDWEAGYRDFVKHENQRRICGLLVQNYTGKNTLKLVFSLDNEVRGRYSFEYLVM